MPASIFMKHIIHKKDTHPFLSGTIFFEPRYESACRCFYANRKPANYAAGLIPFRK